MTTETNDREQDSRGRPIPPDIKEITGHELNAKLDANEGVQLIDVRSPAEFARGHLSGAENVPLSRVLGEGNRRDWAEEIVVICAHGNRSLRAARHLRIHEEIDPDTTIASVTEGYHGWKREMTAKETDADGRSIAGNKQAKRI